MKHLRSLVMQRVIGMLFLLASFLVQVQVLYACTHMELPAQSDCCCEHGSTNPCPVEMDTTVHCCDTQISVTQEFNNSNSVVAARAPGSVEQVFYLLSGIDTGYEPLVRTTPAYDHPPDIFWASRSDTYLHTLRLRV